MATPTALRPTDATSRPTVGSDVAPALADRRLRPARRTGTHRLLRPRARRGCPLHVDDGTRRRARRADRPVRRRRAVRAARRRSRRRADHGRGAAGARRPRHRARRGRPRRPAPDARRRSRQLPDGRCVPQWHRHRALVVRGDRRDGGARADPPADDMVAGRRAGQAMAALPVRARARDQRGRAEADPHLRRLHAVRRWLRQVDRSGMALDGRRIDPVLPARARRAQGRHRSGADGARPRGTRGSPSPSRCSRWSSNSGPWWRCSSPGYGSSTSSSSPPGSTSPRTC